jgi:hypothetical protein
MVSDVESFQWRTRSTSGIDALPDLYGVLLSRRQEAVEGRLPTCRHLNEVPVKREDYLRSGLWESYGRGEGR